MSLEEHVAQYPACVMYSLPEPLLLAVKTATTIPSILLGYGEGFKAPLARRTKWIFKSLLETKHKR